MIITFVCPSGPRPIGGVTALYDFANALARRGHRLHLVHADFFHQRIDSLDDISWFRFEPSITHHVVTAEGMFDQDRDMPRADVIFGTGAPREFGLPVLLVQGFEMLYPWLERDAFRTPCLKVCIASWLVDVGEQFGMPRDQFEVVPMGIDHDRFRVVTPLEERPLQVAVLHNSHPAKGWAVALDALEAVHEDLPDLRAVAFGTSTPEGPVPDWLTFLHDPPQDVLVEQVYNRSRVFLQASDYEGFGFTAVEAMACGCALVTTDNGGSRDYADHDRTALVAPPRDAAGLARHVRTLLTDDARRLALAGAGRAHVQRFDWDLGAAMLEQHLERYLADPARYLREPGPDVPLDRFEELGLAALQVARGGEAPAAGGPAAR